MSTKSAYSSVIISHSLIKKYKGDKMEEQRIILEGAFLNLPQIPVDQFLPIFLSSSAVLLFGLFYVAIYTLVKMELIKKVYMPAAYFFWFLQTYCLYYVMQAFGSDPFTVKILLLAMFGYLLLPHLYYYLNQKAEDRYES